MEGDSDALREKYSVFSGSSPNQMYCNLGGDLVTTLSRRLKKGELTQLDGSEYDWFKGRGPRCTLLVFIDDATSETLHLKFVKSENTFDYFQATREPGHPQSRIKNLIGL